MTNLKDNKKARKPNKSKGIKNELFALRRTDDFNNNLKKIKDHLGTVNDSEVVRQVIKEKADSIN